MAASLPLLGLVIGSVHFSIGPLARLTEMVERMLVPMFKSANVIDLAVISILAGLGEELLFRGVAQYQIAQAIGGKAGPWVGLALASMLFGLMHWITFGYAVLATAIGVYFGWLWMATGDLLAPAVSHAVYDWVVLVYLVKVRGGREGIGN
jgi:membrane protease YdiL (CAAX protease family)